MHKYRIQVLWTFLLQELQHLALSINVMFPGWSGYWVTYMVPKSLIFTRYFLMCHNWQMGSSDSCACTYVQNKKKSHRKEKGTQWHTYAYTHVCAHLHKHKMDNIYNWTEACYNFLKASWPMNSLTAVLLEHKTVLKSWPRYDNAGIVSHDWLLF